MNTVAQSRFRDDVTIRCLTRYFPGTQKRKNIDEPVEQANKRPHTNNQVEVPKGRDDGKNPGRSASPQEQGK